MKKSSWCIASLLSFCLIVVVCLQNGVAVGDSGHPPIPPTGWPNIGAAHTQTLVDAIDEYKTETIDNSTAADALEDALYEIDHRALDNIERVAEIEEWMNDRPTVPVTQDQVSDLLDRIEGLESRIEDLEQDSHTH